MPTESPQRRIRPAVGHNVPWWCHTTEYVSLAQSPRQPARGLSTLISDVHYWTIGEGHGMQGIGNWRICSLVSTCEPPLKRPMNQWTTKEWPQTRQFEDSKTRQTHQIGLNRHGQQRGRATATCTALETKSGHWLSTCIGMQYKSKRFAKGYKKGTGSLIAGSSAGEKRGCRWQKAGTISTLA